MKRFISIVIVSVLCSIGIVACSGTNSASVSSSLQQEAGSSTVVEVTVPNVVGESCDKAETMLWALNFEVEIKSDNGEEIKNASGWIVSAQNPKADSSAAEGSIVKLVVSRTETTVPDVVGKRCDIAFDELEGAGLEVSVASDNGKTVLNRSNWTVVSQDPEPETVLNAGTKVSIVVTKEGDNNDEGISSDKESEKPVEEELENESEDSAATLAQINALAKAKDYLSFTAFSYCGLVDQLKFEGFTDEEAIYGADNCGADWNEQAAKKAQEYLNFTSFSHSGLVEQLEFEGFTYEQAEYGVNSVGL